jgi:flagellum-specific peptidoglycan hydrolase FlgJ
MVQKGGYATDPNYSRTLNKVIATAKYGGTLKLQLGGVVQGKQ